MNKNSQKFNVNNENLIQHIKDCKILVSIIENKVFFLNDGKFIKIGDVKATLISSEINLDSLDYD